MHLSSFIHQKSYEHIEHEIRRDPITLVPGIVGFLLLLILPTGLGWFLQTNYPSFFFEPVSFSIIILFAALYYLSIGLFFYTFFVTFYLDLLIITNDRLLHIEQHSLFSRTISELDLYKIQDVTSEVYGFIPSLFSYGTLQIQTAGAQEKFILDHIPHPESLRQTILDLAEGDRKHHHTP